LNRVTHIQQTALLERRYETKYFPKVEKAIKGEVDHIAGLLENKGIDAAFEYLAGLNVSPVKKVIEDLYQEVGGRFARKQWIEFGKVRQKGKKSFNAEMETKGFGFNQAWVDFIKDFLYRFLLEKITFQVAETTRNVIITVLNEAIEKGWGVEETVRALDELPLSRTQAAKIVRTEITRAANTGTMAAGSTFEFQQQKEWMSARDRRTRGQDPEDHASHIGLDGTVIDYDDVFIDPRNGDQLRYPGDPGGNGIPATSAASTINCRCTIAIVAKVDEKGRLIPKRASTAVVYPNQRRRGQIITV
jgi:hypothetical protein